MSAAGQLGWLAEKSGRLREAALELRKTKWSAPRHWAAFVAYGPLR